MSRHDFSGLSVLVTGASSGVGEATARAFAEAGAHLVIAARCVYCWPQRNRRAKAHYRRQT